MVHAAHRATRRRRAGSRRSPALRRSGRARPTSSPAPRRRRRTGSPCCCSPGTRSRRGARARSSSSSSIRPRATGPSTTACGRSAASSTASRARSSCSTRCQRRCACCSTRRSAGPSPSRSTRTSRARRTTIPEASSSRARGRSRAAPPSPEAIAAAARAIRGARRPLRHRRRRRPLLGRRGGARAPELRPRAHFPSRRPPPARAAARGPLILGGIGVNGTGAANELAAEADLVVCVGTRLTDFTTASRSLFGDPDVRFVGINVSAADARALGAAPVVADARAALEALRPRARRLAGAGRARDSASRDRAAALAAGGRGRSRAAGGRTDEPGPGAARCSTVRRGPATGSSPPPAARPATCSSSGTCPPGASAHIEFGFSCMGHELPAGIGIRLAQPDAGEVSCVIGDGTFLLSPTELVTAVQERAKVTVVVLVNQRLPVDPQPAARDRRLELRQRVPRPRRRTIGAPGGRRRRRRLRGRRAFARMPRLARRHAGRARGGARRRAGRRWPGADRVSRRAAHDAARQWRVVGPRRRAAGRGSAHAGAGRGTARAQGAALLRLMSH